ncbi:MAG: hypothetical protein ACHP79_13115 [Terriglobales bacterium]
MTKNFFRCIEAIALTLVGAMAITPLRAQDAAASPSLLEQLQAQYPAGKFTSRGGCTVTNPETGMKLQKAGIGALPQPSSSTLCAAHYRNGAITRTGFKCSYYLAATKQAQVTLEKGDKVYPTKIEVNKDEVKVGFAYCAGDPGQAALYVGQVVIEFPKDTLKTTGVPQVEDKIAEVFAPDTASQQPDQQQGQDGNATGGQPGNNPPQGDDQQPPDNQTPASTCNVEVGQTVEQVVAACGPPATQSRGATKLLYFYNQPKLKITIVNGKVADIE